jgi:hypothetical protein
VRGRSGRKPRPGFSIRPRLAAGFSKSYLPEKKRAHQGFDPVPASAQMRWRAAKHRDSLATRKLAILEWLGIKTSKSR